MSVVIIFLAFPGDFKFRVLRSHQCRGASATWLLYRGFHNVCQGAWRSRVAELCRACDASHGCAAILLSLHVHMHI